MIATSRTSPLLGLLLIQCGCAAVGPSRPLPTYAMALQCAALTGAHYEQAGAGPEEGRSRFNSAMFWALATSEAARKSKLSAVRFEADMAEQRAKALARLNADDAGADAQLEACLRDVPPLPKRATTG